MISDFKISLIIYKKKLSQYHFYFSYNPLSKLSMRQRSSIRSSNLKCISGSLNVSYERVFHIVYNKLKMRRLFAI